MPHITSLLAIFLASSTAPAAEYDVVVYGGTASGAAAAVQAARMGKTVVLIEPGRDLAGPTAATRQSWAASPASSTSA
jgi:glycine/D-amino acid oxidase-like deaminating enzyme